MAQPLRTSTASPALGPLDWGRIRPVLARTARSTLEYFLKYRALPAGTHDRPDELIDRFHDYLDDGSIPLDEMFEAILDFEEYSKKTFLFYRLAPSTRRKLATMPLPKPVAKLEHATILTRQDKPAVSYSYRTGGTIKVSFAETQRRARFKGGRLRLDPVDRVIVLEADAATGRAALRYDPRVGLNPVRESARASYYDYYREWAERILGAPLLAMDLIQELEALESSALVQLPAGKFEAADGWIDLADGDYRQMKIYEAVAKQVLLKHSGAYSWLAWDHLTATAAAAARPPGLEREVRTEMQAAPALIRFSAGVLRQEVEYVLRHVF